MTHRTMSERSYHRATSHFDQCHERQLLVKLQVLEDFHLCSIEAC